jgi:hypothetical protein
VIVKASSEEWRTLNVGEEATSGGGGTATITLNSWVDGGGVTRNARDLDGDGNIDLDNGNKKFGLLVKNDLRFADFFEVDSASGAIDPPGGLVQSYTAGDRIYRVDVIIYKVDEDADHPSLVRKNLGDNTGFRTIAEDIDNLQVRYQLNDASWTDDPAGSEAMVRAVQVFLLARSAHTHRGYADPNTYNFANNPLTNPSDGYRRKLLCSTIKTRNIGL